MATFNKAAEEWAQLKRFEKIKNRNEREAERKSDNHLLFLLGKLAVDTIPVLREIKVFKGEGATEKNDSAIAPFKKGLSSITANEELMALLEDEISRQKSADNRR